ncbi:Pentatricopeptide repeat [Dillenia turbinata]|uniref:Pentatricopeptide repeat n=1 Tax=Dillenia turbinata TaxID=194707 RepID=A0AAN8V1N3_9MAGN
MSTISLTYFSIHDLSLSKTNLQQKKQDPLWIPTPKLLTQYPILKDLSSCKTLTHLTQIHAQTITTGAINDNFVSSRVLAFLALSPQGSIPYARLLFSQIYNPDVFIANTLIRGYASSKNPLDALAFYVELLENSVVLPDIYTYPLLLKACSESPCVSLGRAIHGHVYKLGFSSEVSVSNFLVQMYASCGVIESAKLVFDRIPECDYASWNIMIGGYLKCGLIESAREVFDGMLERDVISWSVMVNGYVQESRFEEGLKLFREMLAEKKDPNESVLVNALSACAHLGAIEQGAWIEGYLKRNNVGLSVRLVKFVSEMKFIHCSAISDSLIVCLCNFPSWHIQSELFLNLKVAELL